MQDGTDGQSDENLWPFPNEDKIKAVFRESNNPPSSAVPSTNDTKRGFCADGMTLTKYIWEYLGNQIPLEIYGNNASGPNGGINAPINLKIVK